MFTHPEGERELLSHGNGLLSEARTQNFVVTLKAIMTERHFEQHMGKYLILCTLLALVCCFILHNEHTAAFPSWTLLCLEWFCAMCAHVLPSAYAILGFQKNSSFIEQAAKKFFKNLRSCHEGFQHAPITVHSLAFGGRGVYITAGVSTCGVSLWLSQVLTANHITHSIELV